MMNLKFIKTILLEYGEDLENNYLSYKLKIKTQLLNRLCSYTKKLILHSKILDKNKSLKSKNHRSKLKNNFTILSSLKKQSTS